MEILPGFKLMKVVMVELVLACLVGMMVGQVGGERVDMKPYYTVILEHHNNLRRTVSPAAADMREMMWDDTLAQKAEDWSQYCRYERPPRNVFEGGSNMYYSRKHVRSWHSVRSAVLKGLRSWTRGQEYYQYSTDCGTACSYVQMIYSSTYRVGCAMNNCPSMSVRSGSERKVTLLVCFYMPRGRLTSTYPYRSGPQCTNCPAGTYCSDGLCAQGGGVVVSRPQVIRQPERPRPYQPEVPPTTRRPPPPMSSDALTEEETYFLMQTHNMLRTEGGCDELVWDRKLKEWTDWIINCKTDYPGPPYTYTNFYRCPDHMPAYQMVYAWKNEGMDTGLKMDRGCRTPYDRTKCNHYTNVMQPMVTKMACSACNCGDGTRQMVCIYENHQERYYRGYQ